MTSMASASPITRTAGGVLAIVHEGWMRQVSSAIAPATDLRADLWSRWGAVRFVGDQFGDHFRLECALAKAVEGLVSPDGARRVAAARAAVEATSQEFTVAGRHRDPSELTAVLAHRLIDEVARWCVELEVATEHLTLAGLPLAARRLLSRLRVAHALGL